MERPRVIHNLRTKYFDILYSKESTYTAQILAENADILYEKAFESLGATKTFSIPIVISPDSEVLSIKYTFYPYNRITIYEGVPSVDEAGYKDAFIEKFYHELVKAIAGSIKTPFSQFLSVIFGNGYQPLSLINLPYSFVEGIAFTEDKKMNFGSFDDGYFLQILSQAKYDNKFPSWLEASVYNDKYPKNELALASGCAFAAYLQQAYGFEKYYEFWQNCTKVRLGRLTKGNFYKVYNKRIDDVWKEFEDAIPLPENIVPSTFVETVSVSKNSTYRFLSYTKYGIVFFDRIKNEVRLLDLGKEKHLFYASDVENIQVSPDGELLLVALEEYGVRENYKIKNCRVYDLKKHHFKKWNINIRNPSFIQMDDGSFAVAGINVSKKIPYLQIYDLKSNNPVYSVQHNSYSIPIGLTCIDKSTLFYVFSYEQKFYFSILKFNDNFELESEKIYFFNGKIKGIQNVSSSYDSTQDKHEVVFQYVSPEENSFTRLGYLILGSNLNDAEIFIQKNDIPGGVYYPLIYDDGLYFSSRKINYDEIKYVPLSALDFEECEANFIQTVEENFETFEIPTVKQLKEEYDHHFYVPFKYNLLGTMYPLLPIQSFSFVKDFELWPGLGFTYATVSDPFENTNIIFSLGFGFLPRGISDREAFDKAVDDMRENIIKHKNDYSFAFLVKNTSTPVDLKYGALMIYNEAGDYKLSQTGMVSWTHPISLNINLITFSAQFIYSISNSYYDENKRDVYPDLPRWVNPRDAYKLLEWAFGTQFTNVHQAGKTKLEELGVKLDGLLYTTFDLLPEEHLRNLEKTLLKEPRETYYNISLNLGFYFPKLLPFNNPGQVVLNEPFKLYFQTFYEKGVAMKLGFEYLLIGMEPYYGIRPLYMNISRCGLYLGYSYSREYDKSTTELPDFFHPGTYREIYRSSDSVDTLYMKLKVDFVEGIGLLSRYQADSEFVLSYLPRTKDYKFSLFFNLNL